MLIYQTATSLSSILSCNSFTVILYNTLWRPFTLHQVYVGNEILHYLDLIAWCYYQQLQVQLFTKLHQVSCFFLILVTKALIHCNEAQASGVLSFSCNTELISDAHYTGWCRSAELFHHLTTVPSAGRSSWTHWFP